MNFILTKFIYPLEEKLEIFDGYYFDNPRTSEEVKYVEKFIRKASPFPPNDAAVGEEGFITIEYLIGKLKEKYGIDPYVSKYIANCKYKDAYYKTASMWVILRLKDKSPNMDLYFDQAEKVRYRLDALTLLAFENSSKTDFSVLISGEFTSLYEEEIVDKTKNSIIEALVEFTNKNKTEKSKSEFNGFIHYYEGIRETNSQIQNNPNQEMLEYIMESLQTLRKNYDLKMKFVSIVSIIELLLTHCPDSSRFNVEDSINKQFKNKVALIYHLYNNDSNSDLITKECSLIYSLRSDIAHGNFEELPKNLKKYHDFCKSNNYIRDSKYDRISILNTLVNRTLKHMLVVFNMLLNDHKALDIIKKM